MVNIDKKKITQEQKNELIAEAKKRLAEAEEAEVNLKPDTIQERSYWRPRLWVALTTMVTFLLGVYCSYIEIVSVVERPTRPLFCLFLLGAIPITLLLERLRK